MCRVADMINWAKTNKAPALALTDHGNLFNAYDFYKQATEVGVKPIIGCEVYVAPESRHDRDKNQGSPYHLTLLCEDNVGYKNLIQLVSFGYTQGFYRRPRIDMELLGSYSKGLICLTGCMQGQLHQLVNGDKNSEARAYFKQLYDSIPQGNLYVELQNHWIDEELDTYPKLANIAKEYNIPTVATNDCHYMSKDDHYFHDIMLCIQMQQFASTQNRMKFDNEFYFKTLEEMKYAMEGFPAECITNAFEVAERCNVTFDKTNSNPKFPDLPEGQTEYSYLKSLCYEGLTRHYGKDGITDAMRHRLETELSTIDQMGYCGYFLLVWDYANYARQKGYPLGARGSGGGSLVLYTLGVIDFNPMDYGCLFERFLNPDRVSMPDIDIDFGDEVRNDVINYVTEKYGKSRVAHVATFSTLSPKSIVNDAGKALEIPIPTVRSISKEMDQHEDPTAALKQKINDVSGTEKKKLQQLMPLTEKLDGIKRHASCHASAMIISDEPLIYNIPLFTDRHDQIMTQFDGDTLEKMGIVKFDFLGSKALMQAHKCVQTVRKNYDTDITLSTIPLDCEKTYKMVSDGYLEGIFQLEASSGIGRTTKDIAPQTFAEFLTITALFRPGPLNSGMTKQYIARKRGKEKVDYFHPILEDILEETYGLCVYQEQVMQVAQRLANFTPSEADVLRAGMSKLGLDISGQRSKFVKGAVANEQLGFTTRDAEEVFDKLESFGGYGFNKSHTVAYSLLSYRMAYLKAHYTKEFMACVMTREKDNADKMERYVNECKKLEEYFGTEITLYPPHVNDSDYDFVAVDDGILLGLCCIKNVSDATAMEIEKNRYKDGAYKSLADLCKRLPNKAVNKKTVEALIKSGAVDKFEGHRAQLFENAESIMNSSEKSREIGETGQMGLFELAQIDSVDEINTLDDCKEWTESQADRFQNEFIGIRTGKHPLSNYTNILPHYTTHAIENIFDCEDKEEVMVAGVVSTVKEKTTRKGKPLTTFQLEGIMERLECVIFTPANARDKLVASPSEGDVIIVQGRISDASDWSNSVYQIVVKQIMSVENILDLSTDVEIHVPAMYTENASVLEQLKDLILEHKGDKNVLLHIETDKGKNVLKCGQKYKASGDPDFVVRVEALFVENCIHLSNRTTRMELNK